MTTELTVLELRELLNYKNEEIKSLKKEIESLKGTKEKKSSYTMPKSKKPPREIRLMGQIKYDMPTLPTGFDDSYMADSDFCYTPTDIIRKYGLMVNSTNVNLVLKDVGMQVRIGNIWALTKEYSGKGYGRFIKHESTEKGYSGLRWSKEGADFIAQLFKLNEKEIDRVFKNMKKK